MPNVYVLDARDSYGQQLDGKIVVDVTTPVDLGIHEPIYPEAGSVAQGIADVWPRARVVKAFNPAFAGAVVEGSSAGKERNVLLAGDDESAKRIVATVFDEAGLHALDVGPLRRARELEAYGYLHIAARRPLETRLAATSQQEGRGPWCRTRIARRSATIGPRRF